jgi:hypothetical protein
LDGLRCSDIAWNDGGPASWGIGHFILSCGGTPVRARSEPQVRLGISANVQRDAEINASLGYDNDKTIMLMLEKLGGSMPTDVSQFSAGPQDTNLRCTARADSL